MRVFRSGHAHSLTKSSKFHLIKSEFAFFFFLLLLFTRYFQKCFGIFDLCGVKSNGFLTFSFIYPRIPAESFVSWKGKKTLEIVVVVVLFNDKIKWNSIQDSAEHCLTLWQLNQM